MKISFLQTQYHTLAFTYEYNKDAVAFCRLLKDSWGWQAFNFNPTHSAWVFSDPKIIEAIVARFPETVVTDEVKEYSGLKEKEAIEEKGLLVGLQRIRDENTSDIIIPGLKGTLYPFQRAGVEFLVKSGGRAILGDDPGLGKTAQTIGYLLWKGKGRTLVVCPATMKYTWEAELAKWSDLKSTVIESDTELTEIPEDVDVWIINYDLLRRFFTELMKIKFETMVLDEAHYIKSPTALRSKAVKQLSKGCESIIMLTGTAILNRPVEIYNPLSILDSKKWGNYYQFVNRYCAAHRTRFGLDVSGSSNSAELKEKINRYFLRRTKEEVLSELPPKIRTEIPVALSKEHGRIYRKANDSFAQFLRDHKGKQPTEIAKALQAEKLTRLNILRELSATAKMEAASEIIENVIAGGEKIIVFCSFVSPLEALHAKFGTSSVMITGSTGNEERFEIVKQFQTDPDIKVFLGGIKSAGVGITLTAASNVLFIDYSWTPADHKQAEDRAHRADELTRTHDSINIYTLHARGTIDDIMVKMLNKKRKVVESILGEEADDDKGVMSMVLSEIEANALSEA